VSEAAKHAQDHIGYMIVRFSIIEMFINEFITAHYIKDTNDAMNFYAEVVTQTGFTFELKHRIFKDILKTYYPGFDATFPHRKLQKIKEYRNIIAHSGIRAPGPEGFNDLSKLTFSNGGKSHSFMKVRDEFLESQHIVYEALTALPNIHTEKLISTHYEDTLAAKQNEIREVLASKDLKMPRKK
jgi:hypothetical protein